ncbi:MAG: hypothetical protein HKN04_02900 [Rhodothermaceae bacterium]|nr:hypothetical protein [Rhodothermaceae bacterium]
MTPEEFERLKEAEKAHLRQLRALKQQHRETVRKKGVLDALKGMIRPDLDDVHDEMVNKLTFKNIESEARFEVAMEESGLTEQALQKAAEDEAAREELRKAEADSLVQQFKQELTGSGEPAAPSRASATNATGSASGKTIGRVPAPEPEAPDTPPRATDPPAEDLGPKSIGRPRPRATD